MVEEEVVVVKLRLINQYTEDLKQMRGMTRDEYVADMVTQRAVERTFLNLVQSCVDLAQHVRSAEDLSPSGTSKRELEALENAGVVTDATRERMAEAVGFRNVLAHRYGDVDHDIVYDVLHDDLEWFERFQTEVAQWFQQYDS